MNLGKWIKVLSVVYIVVLTCETAVAQSINGVVATLGTVKPIAGAYVTMFKGDSIVAMAQTNAEGVFSIGVTGKGKSVFVVSALGYCDNEFVFDVDTILSPVHLYLEEDIKNVNLREVVVSADASERVTRTANGEIFHLSRQAKSMKNPFRALKEIPLLISNDASSTITMLNGQTPLILIDGNRVNSGIAPINPKEIESVEVINVVPARYLQEGYSGIVNIKLKRIYRNYLWFEGAMRHEIPIGKGFGGFYFEVGNKKYSFYGRGFYNYERNTNTESSVMRSNTNYSQAFNSSDRTNGHKWLGELLYKWSITPRDYMAAHLYINNSCSDMIESGLGEYTEASSVEYGFSGNDVNKNKIITSSLYYKHVFKENNEIEVRAAYNHNGNDFSSARMDYWGDSRQQSYSIFNNRRNSGNADIDYSNSFSNGASLSFGSHITMQSDRITQTSCGLPTFKHNKWNEYLYGAYNRCAEKFSYMLTAGLEMIWLTAGDADNNYLRPRTSLSGTWNIDSKNSLQLSYTLSNTAPEISELNPYNTSTDSMIVTSGNPYLTPEMKHYLKLEYTLSYGKLYVTSSVGYYRVFDMIESDGYSENVVYHSTFVNIGHFSQLLYGVNASQRFKYGRIYGGVVWNDCYYTGMSPKCFLAANFGFNTQFKKFSFNGDFSFQNYSFSQYSTVSYRRPTMAQVQVTYNFTPDLYISLCLQDCMGEFCTRTMVNNGDYKNEVTKHFKNRCMHPWILLRYTFRKNSKNKIKLGKVLNSVEKGIYIKK